MERTTEQGQAFIRYWKTIRSVPRCRRWYTQQAKASRRGYASHVKYASAQQPLGEGAGREGSTGACGWDRPHYEREPHVIILWPSWAVTKERVMKGAGMTWLLMNYCMIGTRLRTMYDMTLSYSYIPESLCDWFADAMWTDKLTLFFAPASLVINLSLLMSVLCYSATYMSRLWLVCACWLFSCLSLLSCTVICFAFVFTADVFCFGFRCDWPALYQTRARLLFEICFLIFRLPILPVARDDMSERWQRQADWTTKSKKLLKGVINNIPPRMHSCHNTAVVQAICPLKWWPSLCMSYCC